MLQALLEFFTTTQKAEAMLENPMIEIIFITLFGLFIITLLIHVALFFKIRSTRNYVKQTKRLDIEPLQSIQAEFETRQTEETIKIDTFIQEKFSNWRLLQMPVVNLIKLVQMTISVFILLGVLGTFIGLTISLSSISPSSDQLVDNVSAVLSGIDVAFYTSIVGMAFSLIMTVLVRVLNTEYLLTDLMLIVESLLESHEQYGMNRMIAVSEMIHDSIQHLQQTNETSLGSIVEAFSGFKDYTEGLQQSAHDLAAFNDGLSDNLEAFQTLFKQMSTVTNRFKDGTDHLNENFDALFAYFENMDRKNKLIANTFQDTADKIQAVSDAQITSLQRFDSSVADIKQFTTSLLEGQSEARDALEHINQKTKKLVDTIGAQTTIMKDIFGEDVSARLEGLSSHVAVLNKSFDHVGNSLGTLPEAIAVITETQKENHHLLGDRFRELKQFNETFSDHLKNHETDTATFENHLRNAATTFETLAQKNNTLIQEVKRTLTEANQQFSQRDQQLVTNTTATKDTLENHVNRIEHTLSQHLTTMIRNIDHTLYTMSETIHRQHTESQRTSEESQQNQARMMQQLLQELGREINSLNRNLSSNRQQVDTQHPPIRLSNDE